MHLYREKELQLAAVRWMADNWGYEELAADQEATGDRVDTIGLLDGQLIAIEVKPEVDRGLVWHDEGRSGLLEPKIAATLRGLYRGETGGQLGLMQARWVRAGPPLIGILAGEYNSTGLFELATMLRACSEAWCFNYRVFRWTGRRVETIGSRDDAPVPPEGAWDRVLVPELVSRPRRSTTPSLADLQALADQHGVGEIFSTFIEAAKARDFGIVRRPSGVGLRRPYREGKAGIVLSLFLDRSDADRGINLGIDAEALGIALDELPGAEAPRAGFMNTNRFIREPEEFARLVERILKR